MNMNKEALFIYEEDGFCELKYTYGDLCKLFVENNQLKEQRQELRSWLEEIIPYLKVHGIRTTPDKVLEDVLNKLNELEGGKNYGNESFEAHGYQTQEVDEEIGEFVSAEEDSYEEDSFF